MKPLWRPYAAIMPGERDKRRETHLTERLNAMYTRLLDHYGDPHWWPAGSTYEVMTGAVLTQNTAWTNVQKAIAYFGDGLSPHVVASIDEESLRDIIRPAGSFTRKARCLKALTDWYALYGYDARRTVPFDTSEPLRLPQYDHNSLKQKNRSILWLRHQDGINGWSKWEHMFEAKLREEFGIKPESVATRVAAPSPEPLSTRPPVNSTQYIEQPAVESTAAEVSRHYNRFALNKLAHRLDLRIEDRTPKGGSLWVLTDDSNQEVTEILSTWGFQHKAGKGWWR